MKQKLLTLLICALMMPIGIWANLLNFTVDGISYYVNGAATRKVMVLGATTSQPAIDPSTTGLLTIPATVVSPDGVEYSVQYIGQNAFKGCTGLTSVKLPNTIINIGGSSFRGCTGLTSISIPSSVTTIDSYAFAECTNLSLFNLPEALEDIYCNSFEGTAWYNNQPDGLIYKDNVFLGEKGRASGAISIKEGTRVIAGASLSSNFDITSITLPNSVKYIGGGALSNLKINSLILPSSLLSIEQRALCSLHNLKSIVIPKSVRDISVGVLNGCPKLETIKVESGNQCFDSRDNCNAIIRTGWYNNKSGEISSSDVTLIAGCKNSIIPETVTFIDQYAFNNCHGLTSIVIPHNVRLLQIGAFNYCSDLTTVKIGKNVGFNMSAFSNCDALSEIYSYIRLPFTFRIDNFPPSVYTTATLYVPKGTKEKYKATDGWKEFQTIVERDDLLIPYEVGEAFTVDGLSYMVTSVDPLEVQVGGTKIGKYYYATDNTTAKSLTSIDIPATVKGFDGKTYNVTNLSSRAFENCTSLTEIHSMLTEPQPIPSAFSYDVYNNATLYVPAGTKLKYKALNGWNYFKKIHDAAPGELGTEDVFSSDGIVYMVTSVKSKEVQVGTGERYKSNAIADKSITAANIPATVKGTDGKDYTVTAIADYAFYYATDLASATIPATVRTIGSEAFCGCKSLMQLQSNIEHPFGTKAFSSVNYDAILYVPRGAKARYEAAEGWTGYNKFRTVRDAAPGELATGDTFTKNSVTYLVTSTSPNEVQVGSKNEKAVDVALSGDIEIPSEITGKDGNRFTVTSVCESAFYDCKNLTEIVLPNSVNDIGTSAFAGCI